MEYKPSWRITVLEMVDPFGWHVLDVATLHFIRGKAMHFDKMTWGQILIDAKKRNHGVEVYKK
jgi:hypothetical protein